MNRIYPEWQKSMKYPRNESIVSQKHGPYVKQRNGSYENKGPQHQEKMIDANPRRQMKDYTPMKLSFTENTDEKYLNFLKGNIDRWKHDSSLHLSGSYDTHQFNCERQELLHKNIINTLDHNFINKEENMREFSYSIPSKDEWETGVKKQRTSKPPFHSTTTNFDNRRQRKTFLQQDTPNYQTCDCLPHSIKSGIENMNGHLSDCYNPQLASSTSYQQQSTSTNFDESNIKIIPQLIGLSPNGQLVLLPMTAAISTDLCFSGTSPFVASNSSVPSNPLVASRPVVASTPLVATRPLVASSPLVASRGSPVGQNISDPYIPVCLNSTETEHRFDYIYEMPVTNKEDVRGPQLLNTKLLRSEQQKKEYIKSPDLFEDSLENFSQEPEFQHNRQPELQYNRQPELQYNQQPRLEIKETVNGYMQGTPNDQQQAENRSGNKLLEKHSTSKQIIDNRKNSNVNVSDGMTDLRGFSSENVRNQSGAVIDPQTNSVMGNVNQIKTLKKVKRFDENNNVQEDLPMITHLYNQILQTNGDETISGKKDFNTYVLSSNDYNEDSESHHERNETNYNKDVVDHMTDNNNELDADDKQHRQPLFTEHIENTTSIQAHVDNNKFQGYSLDKNTQLDAKNSGREFIVNDSETGNTLVNNNYVDQDVVGNGKDIGKQLPEDNSELTANVENIPDIIPELLNESLFSSFSDNSSGFELPSQANKDRNADVGHHTKPNKTIIPDTSKDNIEVNNTDESLAEESVLFYLIEKLSDRIHKNSDETLVLNVAVDVNQVNTITASCEIEADLSKFNLSELCMAYKFHLEGFMHQKKDTPFLGSDIDPNIDFEGDLRDCVEPCFLDIWDGLFSFLVSVIDVFEFDHLQISNIFSHALLPRDSQLAGKFQLALANILNATKISQEGSASTDKPNEEHSVSITEDFDKVDEENNQLNPPVEVSKNISNEGDLSKSLSLDIDVSNEDDNLDSSSTMLFDSDGLPVKKTSSRTKDTNKHSKGEISYSEDFVETDDKVLDTSSSAYQKMRQMSLLSPLYSNSDDDGDNLEGMLGESIKLYSKTKNRNPLVSSSSTNHVLPKPQSIEELSIASSVSANNNSNRNEKKSDNKSESQEQICDSNKTKVKLKAPGFWNDSDSDIDLDEVKIQANQQDDDDDFDFDFYD